MELTEEAINGLIDQLYSENAKAYVLRRVAKRKNSPPVEIRTQYSDKTPEELESYLRGDQAKGEWCEAAYMAKLLGRPEQAKELLQTGIAEAEEKNLLYHAISIAKHGGLDDERLRLSMKRIGKLEAEGKLYEAVNCAFEAGLVSEILRITRMGKDAFEKMDFASHAYTTTDQEIVDLSVEEKEDLKSVYHEIIADLDEPFGYWNLAEMAAAAGLIEDAVEHCKHVIDDSDNYMGKIGIAETFEKVGDVAKKMGRDEEANECFTRARELYEILEADDTYIKEEFTCRPDHLRRTKQEAFSNSLRNAVKAGLGESVRDRYVELITELEEKHDFRTAARLADDAGMTERAELYRTLYRI